MLILIIRSLIHFLVSFFSALFSIMLILLSNNTIIKFLLFSVFNSSSSRSIVYGSLLPASTVFNSMWQWRALQQWLWRFPGCWCEKWSVQEWKGSVTWSHTGIVWCRGTGSFSGGLGVWKAQKWRKGERCEPAMVLRKYKVAEEGCVSAAARAGTSTMEEVTVRRKRGNEKVMGCRCSTAQWGGFIRYGERCQVHGGSRKAAPSGMETPGFSHAMRSPLQWNLLGPWW